MRLMLWLWCLFHRLLLGGDFKRVTVRVGFIRKANSQGGYQGEALEDINS